jgi:hypothetical protein
MADEVGDLPTYHKAPETLHPLDNYYGLSNPPHNYSLACKTL